MHHLVPRTVLGQANAFSAWREVGANSREHLDEPLHWPGCLRNEWLVASERLVQADPVTQALRALCQSAEAGMLESVSGGTHNIGPALLRLSGRRLDAQHFPRRQRLRDRLGNALQLRALIALGWQLDLHYFAVLAISAPAARAPRVTLLLLPRVMRRRRVDTTTASTTGGRTVEETVQVSQE